MENENMEIKLNVGGKKLVTTLSTLISFPDSTLAKMFSSSNKMQPTILKDSEGYFILDRDPKIFNEILNICRYGKFPKNPKGLLKEEINFWFPGELLKFNTEEETIWRRKAKLVAENIVKDWNMKLFKRVKVLHHGFYKEYPIPSFSDYCSFSTEYSKEFEYLLNITQAVPVGNKSTYFSTYISSLNFHKFILKNGLDENQFKEYEAFKDKIELGYNATNENKELAKKLYSFLDSKTVKRMVDISSEFEYECANLHSFAFRELVCKKAQKLLENNYQSNDYKIVWYKKSHKCEATPSHSKNKNDKLIPGINLKGETFLINPNIIVPTWEEMFKKHGAACLSSKKFYTSSCFCGTRDLKEDEKEQSSYYYCVYKQPQYQIVELSPVDQTMIAKFNAIQKLLKKIIEQQKINTNHLDIMNVNFEEIMKKPLREFYFELDDIKEKLGMPKRKIEPRKFRPDLLKK